MEEKQTLFSIIVMRLFGSQMLFLVPIRVLICIFLLHHMKPLTHHLVFLTYMCDINVVALLFTANLYFCLYCFSFKLENHFLLKFWSILSSQDRHTSNKRRCSRTEYQPGFPASTAASGKIPTITQGRTLSFMSP